MPRRLLTTLAVLCLALSLAACSKKTDDSQMQPSQSATSEQPAQTTPEPAVPPPSDTSATSTTTAPATTAVKPRATTTKPAGTKSNLGSTATATKPAAAQPIEIPAGTVMTVRLDSAVGSKSSNAGDTFTATVADPVEVDGTVVIPKGAEASGTVHEAVPAGRIKGGSKLRISLDHITINGKRYQIASSSVEQAGKGRGKRTAAMGGGGAAVGALIGGLTGGGKGAAIGALVGGGAGTAGAAYTGNRDIELPAETALSIKLTEPLSVK